MNRLADATSPYLLQHADNPVDWFEWGEPAFAEARRRDVPIMISVGYSACHWCHVMAHESFEDPEVGRALNEGFVSIKVDREERPDVDAVYMTATQAMTGQGGWPMTVFATPEGEPFFCGTYFPKPQFTQLLRSVGAAWRDQRDAVTRQSAAVVEALARVAVPPGAGTALDEGQLDAAAAQLVREQDQVNGGFGDAPKFPPHMNLLFLLRQVARTGDPGSLELVRHTSEQMARGGIYDQLGGGFARYSVDATWTVPHFEKMLYDNALLLRAYTQLWRRDLAAADGSGALAGRVARETVGFLLRDLLLPEGGFASALDADTDGVEGATYVWTPAQLREVLGEADGDWAADVFGVTEPGTFEHGTSVLQLARDIDGADPTVVDRWQRVRRQLALARAQRPQPARDDKVVAAWNGLTVTALAEYLSVARTVAAPVADPEQPPWLDELTVVIGRAAEVLASHIVDGRLRRVSRDGVVGQPAGVLDDYGAVAEAFCAVHQLTGEGRWLTLAGELLEVALTRFDNGQGGFFDTADDAEQLVARPADPTDNASPSGLSAVAGALTAYAALTGEARYREAAQRALATVAPLAQQHPRFIGYACAVGEALLSGPYEIAIVTDDPVGDPLVRTAYRLAPPGAVVVAGGPDQPGVPLLAGRTWRGGESTAYVCRQFVCDRPVTDEQELAAQLT
ncbi:thioredoxin domain-containing protein [Natronosporangium hydrolyticum]|uniref:Thioredoxin domain-containing protein n=1 Tax=Natronosporangium hydrolyticum TaxID=2811111 RepID=A0A895YCH9_9ACTN|nr:thioredoxin domain-containing protein [Natronosporangium hydrolyticum]QSB13925.1 thioredoxin domain-containing protein [Natronosporangium hydrolyticum]